MAYYVRKIARAKWCLLDETAENEIENYRADAIANDMRTTNDTLSFWKAESLDSEEFEPVIVINSLMGDNIKTIDLLCIPEDMLSEFSLVQEDGDTIAYEYKGLHYNVVSLSVKSLVDFARNIVLNILSLADTHPEMILKIRESQQLQLLTNWLDSGKLNYDELKDKQKKAIEKFRAKGNQQRTTE